MRLFVYHIAAVYLALCTGSIFSVKLKYQWKQLEFQFPSNAERQNAISLNHYIPGVSVPIDLYVDRKGQNDERMFITIPRQGPGRPFTLATVSSSSGPGGPLLLPYPDYSWNTNQGSNCDGLTSVFRIAADDCNRLWVLDAGIIGSTESCPPQLLAFDLKTDKLLLRYKIPKSQLIGRNLLVNPVPDVQSLDDSCKNTFVYIADPIGFGLIVYDGLNNRSWRIENKEFYPTPAFGTHTIAGQSFDLMAGIFGLALYPNIYGKPADTLYFHSLASNVENTVSTSVIKNFTLFQNNRNASPRSFKKIPGSRPTQAVAQAFDKTGRLYFGQYDPIAMYRWDKETPFKADNFHQLAHNNERLQFISAVKIFEEHGKEVLWIMSNRFQRGMTNTLDSSETNFRIFRAFLEDPDIIDNDLIFFDDS